jgi:hypothetical protein
LITRTSTFVALLLLALWLPATQHCGLEAAGVLTSAVECHDAASCDEPQGTSPCDLDNCQSIEDAAYKAKQTYVQLSTPVELACLCCLNAITPKTIIVSMITPAQTDAPPELAPSWQFTTRAAPAPRAPSILA